MQTIALEQLIDLDRRAVLASVAVVGRCDDRLASTPCAGWDVQALLEHMTAQHVGFARAAAGERTTVADWRPRPARDAISDYVDAAAAVLSAFAAVDDPGAPVLLPEIREAPVPAQLAIGFHLVDYVVHTWDVAASVGCAVPLGPDVLDVALFVARQVPDGPEREKPGAAFAPARPVPPAATALDEILALLGRDPAWAAE